MNSKTDYAGGLLPPEFLSFIKFSAILGFIAALVLTSAIVYKVIEKIVGKEEAKKYRWAVVIVDLVVLFIFIFIYVVFF
jgi:hypothetical protein